MTVASKVWFITGVGRGFGKALTEAVLAKGDIVIGTTRDGRAAFERGADRLHLMPLEITDAQAIAAVVEKAWTLHGRLDVVVNNAGYGLLGSVEEASDAEINHLFDVNFHGTRRVIQAVLPRLRAQRSGHIVNITSIAGLAPGAGAGFYAATKFAVEGLSQSLAQEVAPLGIKVTIVEPGAFRTDFLSDHSIRSSSSGIDDYASTSGANIARLGSMAGKQIGDPVRGVAAIIEAVESPKPPLHLLLGSDALARAQEMHSRFAEDIAQWKSVTLGTDFGSP